VLQQSISLNYLYRYYGVFWGKITNYLEKVQNYSIRNKRCELVSQKKIKLNYRKYRIHFDKSIYREKPYLENSILNKQTQYLFFSKFYYKYLIAHKRKYW